MPLLRLPIVLVAACVALLVPAAAQAVVVPPTLTVNIGKYPTSLDPGKARTEADLVVQNALFAPLYRSPGGSGGRLVPVLASRAPIMTNGGRTWIVPLRAARWTDGRAITSGDVRTAWMRGRGSLHGRNLAAVTSISTPSLRTVRINLATPVPHFEELLASNVLAPVPTHVVRRHGVKWTMQRNIASSGPFRLLSTRGASEIVLVRNTRYFAARIVRLPRLKLLALPPASASTLFDAKRLDATMRDTSSSRAQLRRRQTDPRFRTVAASSAQYLHLNTRAPELANPATRRGIALAIDRARLVQASSYGVDRPLDTLVPAGIRGSATVAPPSASLLAESGAPDRVRARQELAAGPWPAGATFDLWYLHADGASTIAARIADDLGDVGIRVQLHPVLSPAEFAKVGLGTSPVRADVDAVLAGWSAEYSDPVDFHRRLTCGQVDAGRNLANFCAAGYDSALFAASGAMQSFVTRMVAQRAIEEQLTGPSGAMPVVPLYEAVGDYLVQPWVRGFVHRPSGRVDFERVVLGAR